MNAQEVAQRLASAKSAVMHVKDKVRLGSNTGALDPYIASRLKTIAKQKGYSEFGAWLAQAAVLPIRTMAAFSIMYYRHEDKAPMPSVPTLGLARRWATQAEHGRAGNCEEQTCVALTYLYDHQVRPLDWMHLTNGSHAFVLIGRDEGAGADPSTWGENVVVCDAWKDAAYYLDPRSAKETLLARMNCGCSTANSILRIS
jgi:hypothetical protein